MDGLNDWDWDAMANGFCPTIDASYSSFALDTATLMPTIPNTATMTVNNGQMMDGVNDWGLHAAVNNFLPNTVASSSSFTPVTATFNPSIPTAQTIPINNSKMMEGFNDWNIHGTVNELYSSFAGSSSSFSFSFSSSTYSVNPTVSTTIPLNTTDMPVPTGNYNQQNTSFYGEMSNQHHPMNIANIKQMLQNSNYPINVPKVQNPSSSNKNLAVVYHPNHGNIPTVSKYHYPYPYPQQQRYQPPPQQNQLQINQQTIRVSEHVNSRAQLATKQSKTKTKRIYKMPVQGLNTDKLSWKKYGAKLINDSQYPRVYYKCTVTKDCKVRRKVELNKSDSNTLIVTYSGNHNHLPPYAGNVFASSTNSDSINNHNISNTDETNHPNFSNTISPPTMLSFGRKKAQKNKNVNRDEDIFGGLEDFIPL